MGETAIKKQREKVEKRIGLSDHIGYAALIKDNVIVLKDGSLQAVYRFYADDVASLTDDIQASLAARWHEAVCQLWGDSLIIETDMIRRPINAYSDSTVFPDVVSALIDQERQYQFEQGGELFETITYVSFTWRPAKALSKKSKNFMFDSDVKFTDKLPAEEVREFESRLSQFVNFVAYGDCDKFERQSGDALISFLDHCITGANRSVAAPEQRIFLDTYLAKDEFIGGFEPVIGKRHIKILAFDSYPLRVKAMLLHDLNRLAIPFRYHTRYIVYGREAGNRLIDRQRKNWSNKVKGFMSMVVDAFGGVGQEDASSIVRRDNMIAAKAENESGNLKYGLFNGAFVLHDEDIAKLNSHATELLEHVQQHSFVMREEAVNASDAFFGSLPGHGGCNTRINLFDSVAWAMTMPLSAVYSGEANCPNPLYPANSAPLIYSRTDESNVYRFTNCVSDVGHTLLLGPTGSGKTTLLDLMLSQHRKYPDSRQVFLGKDASGKLAILAHGGQFLDALDTQHGALAPLSQLNTDFGFGCAERWLTETFELQGCTVDGQRASELHRQLSALAKRPVTERQLNHLVLHDKALREVLQALNTGIYKTLMNGTDDAFFHQSLFGMDVGTVLKGLKRDAASSILQATLDKLEFAFQDAKPTLLILDEAWLFLDHPLLLARLKDWLKTLRKHNVSVIFSSQSVSDVTNSPICDVLLESCPTRIFLPNKNVSDDRVFAQYHQLGLNNKQIEIIGGATPKQHYYVMQPHGNRLMDLGLGELALAFVGVGREDAERFYQHYNSQDKEQRWVLPYLRHRQLNAAADFIDKHYFSHITEGNDDTQTLS